MRVTTDILGTDATLSRARLPAKRDDPDASHSRFRQP